MWDDTALVVRAIGEFVDRHTPSPASIPLVGTPATAS
jgi:hypothetical protein